jgi:hypothetical protein
MMQILGARADQIETVSFARGEAALQRGLGKLLVAESTGRTSSTRASSK